ncbi:hypothetical protein Nepgr_018757 [Nepenthes gracilis]|uniref:Uncharacterized protein n=1 Tax=Nepenthes gracilis TaxID=150966 RepID=A0AAD3SU57_NEPGR|nr:hypothetical protein Nepgr_018757 [Nepenthes gracilis]
MLWLWQCDPILLGSSSASRKMLKLDSAVAISSAAFCLAAVQMLMGDVAVGTLGGSLLDVEKVFQWSCSCWPWANRPWFCNLPVLMLRVKLALTVDSSRPLYPWLFYEAAGSSLRCRCNPMLQLLMALFVEQQLCYVMEAAGFVDLDPDCFLNSAVLPEAVSCKCWDKLMPSWLFLPLDGRCAGYCSWLSVAGHRSALIGCYCLCMQSVKLVSASVGAIVLAIAIHSFFLLILGLNAYAAMEMGSIANMVGCWVVLAGSLSAVISGSCVCSLTGYRPAVL